MQTTEEVHYTPRELQIIKLLLLRYYRKKIGTELHIVSGTVDNHIKHLYKKTNSHNIAELIIFILTHDFAINSEGTIVTYKDKAI
ncbi:MAG: LuxR C-terminal-related transcriptional regulator [Bacteroidota bacterium]